MAKVDLELKQAEQASEEAMACTICLCCQCEFLASRHHEMLHHGFDSLEELEKEEEKKRLEQESSAAAGSSIPLSLNNMVIPPDFNWETWLADNPPTPLHSL
jgi:hypothetical protein